MDYAEYHTTSRRERQRTLRRGRRKDRTPDEKDTYYDRRLCRAAVRAAWRGKASGTRAAGGKRRRAGRAGAGGGGAVGADAGRRRCDTHPPRRRLCDRARRGRGRVGRKRRHDRLSGRIQRHGPSQRRLHRGRLRAGGDGEPYSGQCAHKLLDRAGHLYPRHGRNARVSGRRYAEFAFGRDRL